ncbi:MAG: hypothetical protein HC822_10790 [Oscillochloris sp.]|nr:hypothetical protein [Oscillochloris sp.]
MEQPLDRKQLPRGRERNATRNGDLVNLAGDRVESHSEDDELIEGVSVRGVMWRWQVRRRRQN